MAKFALGVLKGSKDLHSVMLRGYYFIHAAFGLHPGRVLGQGRAASLQKFKPYSVKLAQSSCQVVYKSVMAAL